MIKEENDLVLIFCNPLSRKKYVNYLFTLCDTKTNKNFGIVAQ